MEKIKFLLDPIPNTNNYLIIKLNAGGEITELGMRTNEYLIKKWGANHRDRKTIIDGLRNMAEITLYD